MNEIVVLLRAETNRYGGSIRTDLAVDLPKITADRVQPQQVVMNLMLNAIEAMNETGGEPTVRSELDQDGGVMISVCDTGVGLPAENADRIFNVFFTAKPQGSGMGLAISRSIVESHGGRLWATSNSGRGATFHLTLPAAAQIARVPAGQGASMCSLIRSISTSGRYLIGRRCGRCRRGRLPLVLGFLFCLFQTKQFLHRKDPVRAVLAEPLEVEIFDEYRQGSLPRLLLVVVDLAELLRVHPQFPSHLDVGMRQVVASTSIDPGLYCRIGLVCFLGH